MVNNVKRALKEGLVFRAHERTKRKLSVVSDRAGVTINKMDEKIDECRSTQSEFFNARRKINKAACQVAENHKIDMELVDVDSDDERQDYYTGKNVLSVRTRCSSSHGYSSNDGRTR